MKRILTGIRPTGKIHLGHYLGFIKNLFYFQDKYQTFLMIADLHAQTHPFPYHPRELKKNTFELVKDLLALGLNPQKITLFRQADIPAHLYLYWIFGCLTPLGELQRMHQFKEWSQKYNKESIKAGILMYPVLQAADILLYQADLVPVGKDQVQHVEFTREMVKKFNYYFGKTFKLPEVYLEKETEKIMSLTNPTKKMSKSEPEGCLFIFDDEKTIKEKIKKAVTDSGHEIKYDPLNKPGISNLMIIYKTLTQKPLPEIEKEFEGLDYNHFKEKIIEAFFNYFKEARIKRKKLKDKDVLEVLAQGKKKASQIAQKTLTKVLIKVGLK